MQSSLHSRDHSIPVAKTSLPKKKKKNIRRRRVDLQCGCSYYISINCHDHGFTHRGIHHCGSSREWRVYLGRSKSPVFQDFETRRETLPHEPRHYNSPNPVQPQPEESTGASQVFSNIPDLDGLTPSDWAFLESFQNPGP
ncbi:transcriptional activator protein [Tomato leaf curl Palampur virus]|uniref:Transcriptional activator protein n=1 Tax=Tomato leaf curl Palampur virus TaxID=526476 RepID=A0A168TE42_9GEMI|nr:transcriptional activator protein [Tomato leaf curl Palampur virus]SAM29879.1 transcriptional activator protein [Tomato leaf curl Palampur virus]SAM29916.1 transcriptional activator protein [Tomato leaf curl Palampur virus]